MFPSEHLLSNQVTHVHCPTCSYNLKQLIWQGPWVTLYQAEEASGQGEGWKEKTKLLPRKPGVHCPSIILKGEFIIFFSSRVREIRLEEMNSNTGCSLNIVCFLKILKYSWLWSFSVFPRCQCVYTNQAGRTPALQQNWQSPEKSQHLKEKHNI